MSALEIATTAAFYAALIIGVPTVLISYRCAYILIRKAGFRKNSFYRIFVASLISNSLVFLLLMHNLRFPGIGWFPNYYGSIKQAWWLPMQSFVTRLFYNLSLLLSFMLSLNCATRIMLKEEVYTKYDQYWVVVEIVLDIVCNTFVIVKFIQSRRVIKNEEKRPIEKSYYLLSLTNFVMHTATTVVHTALRYDLIPQSALTITFLFSNAILDATVLLPTVFVLVFTPGVRDDFKKLIFFSFQIFVATESNTALQSSTIEPAIEQPR